LFQLTPQGRGALVIGNISDRQPRSGRLEIKLALEITSQVAAGLAAVNKQKLVHRDIKPSNIMASPEEGGTVTAKIIDPGLAKPVNEPGSQTAISLPGHLPGHPNLPVPSNSPESVWTSVQTCTRLA
jgi:serine/threonine protein kinase